MPGQVLRGPFRPWLGIAFLAIAAGRAGSEDSQATRLPRTPWRDWQAVPIASVGGRARFQVPCPQGGGSTLVIVSALARSAGPFPIRLSSRGVAQASPTALASPGVRSLPAFNAAPLAPIPPPPGGLPPRERVFHLLVRDGDVASASNYLPVQGRLLAAGRRVQVYVDAQDVGKVGPEVLRDLVTAFDESVFPVAARTIGQARDVDGDGRFTVLMSSWLARLAGGRHAVDGFIRGADLDPGLSAPFSNRCDMMYMNTGLKAGAHLRTVLAHEYTHAVTYSAKTFNGPGGERLGGEEEGWLDEALAHLGEDLHGFSRSNLDYRISAFLSSPERYRLVVEDYYGADLFRSHGNRGSTYLFLRWCADRFGPALLPTLIRSRSRGLANLEAATGRTFADLYREWSVALALGGMEPGRDHAPGYQGLDVRSPLDGWELAGPRIESLGAGGGSLAWSCAGTASHYVVVEGTPAAAVDVEVAGPPHAELQVTAIPLPADLARLELSARVSSGPGGGASLRARIDERRGTSVRLSTLAWEPLVPAAHSQSSPFRHSSLDSASIASHFATAIVPGGGRLLSGPIPLPGILPGGGPLVFKAIGIDARGRKVSAWAEVDPSGEVEADDDVPLVP